MLGPLAVLGIGAYLAVHMHSVDTVLVSVLVGECLAVVGIVAGIVRALLANRPAPREAPPAVLRVRAEPIGREPVYVVTTAPERLGIEPGRVSASGRPGEAHEPARARVVRSRPGAGSGPGR